MKNIYIITTILIVFVVLAYIVVDRHKESKGLPEVDTNAEISALTVLPQIVTDTVFIERIVLKDSGFLAVRSIENGRLGQIIEISSYLLAGEHTDIKINLGEFYDGNTDLVVVVYEDEKDDKVFNDLDQPMKDSDGKTIARYVANGEAVPTELFSNNGEVQPHVMGGMAMEVIRYTNTGYEPKELTVTAGTMVQFINESDIDMWVASNEHPGHTDLPTFDQFGLYPKGSTYMYTFDKVGTWEFHDHLNPEYEGSVIVQ